MLNFFYIFNYCNLPYLKNISNSRVLFFKIGKPFDLLIFDDFFPNPISGFRTDEFTYLLQYYARAAIYVKPIMYELTGSTTACFKGDLKKYTDGKPNLKSKIHTGQLVNINTKLAYTLFLGSAFTYLNLFEALNIPFVFSLYPGGKFKMNDAESDRMLTKVTQSRLFKGVIVNQLITKDYLLKKRICKSTQILLVDGIPVAHDKINFNLENRKYFGKDKSSLSVFFCAMKYMEGGKDKGFDIFIEVVNYFKNQKNINFHIIGDFTENDLEMNKELPVFFHGKLSNNIFFETLKQADVILSPNRAGYLGKGTFDGFPLGTCIDASLAGALIIATDELNQNTFLNHSEDIFVIKPDYKEIADIIDGILNGKVDLVAISKSGSAKMKNYMNFERQMTSRINFFNNMINS